MNEKCSRCKKNIGNLISWFTSQNICQKCLDSEDRILVQLSNNSQDIWDYAGCGYISEIDGSNWIEKEKE